MVLSALEGVQARPEPATGEPPARAIRSHLQAPNRLCDARPSVEAPPRAQRRTSARYSNGRKSPSTPTPRKTISAPSSPSAKSPAEPSAKREDKLATSCSASPGPASNSKSPSSTISATGSPFQDPPSHTSQPSSLPLQPDQRPAICPGYQDSPQPIEKSEFVGRKNLEFASFSLEFPSFSLEDASSDLENTSLKR